MTVTRSFAGVGFIVSPRVLSAVVCFKSVSDRLAILRVKVSGGMLNFVSAYAPQSALPFEQRFNFFSDLAKAVPPATTHSSTLVMGDFNARLGGVGPGEENIIGPFAFEGLTRTGDTATNRDLLMECCHV